MKNSAFFGFLLLSAAAARAWAGLSLGDGSKLWLEGDSTLHKYSSVAAKIDFSAELPPAPASLQEAVKGGRVTGLRLAVPVAELKSGEKGLDKNLVKALKGDENKEIVYTMDGYTIDESTSPARITATGTLSIAGVEKPAQLEGRIKTEASRIVIDGEKPLVMTDFGVKPPKLMLGAIKVDKNIVVKFHLEMERK